MWWRGHWPPTIEPCQFLPVKVRSWHPPDENCFMKLFHLSEGDSRLVVRSMHTVTGLGGSMREKDFGVGDYKPPRLLRARTAPPTRPQPSGVRFVRSPSRGSCGGSTDTLNQSFSASVVRTQGALIRKEVSTSGPPATPARRSIA